MSLYARRRLVAAGVAVLALAVVAFVLASGGTAAPANGAAKLVPAGALAYVHISTDTGRSGTRGAVALLRRFPDLERAANGLVGSLARTGHGLGVDYRRDIAPWIGKEAALALVDEGNGVASSEIAVAVRDANGARGFLGRLGSPTGREVAGGVEILRYGGQAVTLVHGFLVTGPDSVVRQAIALAQGHGATLAGTPAYVKATSGAPAGRVLDAYATGAGVNSVLRPAPGPLGALGALLAHPGLRGATVALSAGKHSARVWVHEALSRDSTATPFQPTLDSAVSAPAIAFLDVAGLDRALPSILALSRVTALTGELGSLLRRAGAALRAAGVVPARDLAPLVAGETAVAVTPGALIPTVTIVARTGDEPRARRLLASLQGPLARVLGAASTGAGTVPTVTQTTVAGVTAYRLRVTPALEVDYAVAEGRILVSTGLSGISTALSTKHPLASDRAFRSVIGGHGPVTAVLFVDPDQLLRLGEQVGLDQDPQFHAVRNDLRRVHAVGLESSSGEADTTAELSLQIP